jgi:hypothetical protein
MPRVVIVPHSIRHNGGRTPRPRDTAAAAAKFMSAIVRQRISTASFPELILPDDAQGGGVPEVEA